MTTHYCGMKMLMAESHRRMIVDDVPTGGLMFEWGVGGTSAWIADELAKKEARLFSVEHCTEWAERAAKVAKAFGNWTVTCLKPSGGYTFPNAKPEEENPALLRDYVLALENSSFHEEMEPDVVLVDGVARGACLMTAADMMPQPRVIYLHDTSRRWYEWAILHLTQVHGWRNEDFAPQPGEYPASITRLTRGNE